MHIASIGIDLARPPFTRLAWENATNVLLRKKFSSPATAPSRARRSGRGVQRRKVPQFAN